MVSQIVREEEGCSCHSSCNLPNIISRLLGSSCSCLPRIFHPLLLRPPRRLTRCSPGRIHHTNAPPVAPKNLSLFATKHPRKSNCVTTWIVTAFLCLYVFYLLHTHTLAVRQMYISDRRKKHLNTSQILLRIYVYS